MASPTGLLTFRLDRQLYALRLSVVEQVVRSVEVTSLPDAPGIVVGVVNLRGRIVPVINIRKRFQIAERPIELSDRFIIANAGRRTVAIIVDEIADIDEVSDAAMVCADDVLLGLGFLEGVVKRPDGIVLIHDLARFLSLEEERTLERSLAEHRAADSPGRPADRDISAGPQS